MSQKMDLIWIPYDRTRVEKFIAVDIISQLSVDVVGGGGFVVIVVVLLLSVFGRAIAVVNVDLGQRFW